MIAEYGLIFLILSMLLSAFQFLLPLYRSLAYPEGAKKIIFSVERNSELIFYTTLVSYCCLVYCFVVSDFSLVGGVFLLFYEGRLAHEVTLFCLSGHHVQRQHLGHDGFPLGLMVVDVGDEQFVRLEAEDPVAVVAFSDD